jgi:LSD1 subclass zinc finger protein
MNTGEGVTTNWYCPSCRHALPDGSETVRCPACKADFGPDAAWGPVENNRGEWVPRPRADVDDRPSISYALFRVVGRLLIGAVVWLVVAALVLMSAVPYGGGNRGLIGLLKLVTYLIPLWAAFPLLTTLYELIAQSIKKSKPTSRERRRDD